MRLLAGTSGYAFKEWKGSFYPEDLKDDAMLGFYAGRFPAVEINNTFYRLPREHVLLDWASQVPDDFTFAIKASQRITHHARLKPECASAVEFLLKNTSCLAGRCGPILFQLPPNLHRNDERLEGFLDALPDGHRYSVEFRHPAWYADEVLEMLRKRNVALCLSDHHDGPAPWEATADFIYLRGHGPGGRYHGRYGEAALTDWAKAIRSWRSDREVFVYFDNDIKSAAPQDAEQLIGLLERSG